MNKGIVVDIRRSSVHDGPGLRTTVFLKGCPLHCRWCHNPECIDFAPQTLFYPDKCIGCGRCAEGCFSGARVLCGKQMTAEEVLAVIEQDRPYYGKNGGMTLSGGEPQAQPGFAEALLSLCREKGISTAMETSLYLFRASLLQQVDFLLADLKIWDDEKHIAYTGVSNQTIKENFHRADALGIPLLVHTPLIPGVNDGLDELEHIARFVYSLKNTVSYELLPYHPLGLEKARALGQTEEEFEVPSKKRMEELQHYVDAFRPA